MFSNTYLPPLISLFSSTSSLPLQLFSQHTDLSLKEDSLIHLLNDSTSLPSLAGGVLIEAPAIMSTEEEREDIRKDAERSGEEKREGKTLCQTVLHIQSPTLRTTFIRCPPLHTRSSAAGELGITLPWIHLQVRNLGREWSFEVGITDREGKKGVIRCSTFQRTARLIPHSTLPLLHIPLHFPPSSSHPLTTWSDVDLDLGTTMQYFTLLATAQLNSSARDSEEDDDDDNSRLTPGLAPLPSGKFGKVVYVKVYANCRLRRIWFSEGRREGELPWELGLFGIAN